MNHFILFLLQASILFIPLTHAMDTLIPSKSVSKSAASKKSISAVSQKKPMLPVTVYSLNKELERIKTERNELSKKYEDQFNTISTELVEIKDNLKTCNERDKLSKKYDNKKLKATLVKIEEFNEKREAKAQEQKEQLNTISDELQVVKKCHEILHEGMNTFLEKIKQQESLITTLRAELTQKSSNPSSGSSQQPTSANIEFAKKYLSTLKSEQESAIFVDVLPPQISTIIKALCNPEEFRKYVLSKQLNIFLYGPPGGGKTTIARYIALKTKRLFFNITAGDIQDTYVSSGARNITNLIMGAYHLAKQHENKESKAIIFIDEIDALLSTRRDNSNCGSDENNKTVAAFLGLIDGFDDEITNTLTIIGATNRKNAVDNAALDRFAYKINVDPTATQRACLMKAELSAREKIDSNKHSEIISLLESRSYISLRSIGSVLNKAGLIAFEKESLITDKEVQEALEDHTE